MIIIFMIVNDDENATSKQNGRSALYTKHTYNWNTNWLIFISMDFIIEIFFYSYSIAFIIAFIIDMSAIVRLASYPSTRTLSFRSEESCFFVFLFPLLSWRDWNFCAGVFFQIINATREKWMLWCIWKIASNKWKMEKISKPYNKKRRNGNKTKWQTS